MNKNTDKHPVIDKQLVVQRVEEFLAAQTDEQGLIGKEREVARLSERYRLIFENSIIGLSFYSPEGWLLDANRIMRQICNFDGENSDSFYSKANLFEQSPFSEVLNREHPDEYWACSLSIVPEKNMYVYLEISVHPIYDENDNLVYIAVSAHDVTEERRMYLQVKENDVQLQQVKESIQNYEAELRYMMEACQMQAWRISLDRDCIEFYSGLNTVVRSFSLEQMKKIFVKEDDFVKALEHPEVALAKPLAYIGQMYPVVTQSTTELQWVQINCIPEFDHHGRLLGCFGVWRNINDLMRKQEQLRKETQRANESGQMKSVFLANMTHEIRTPLNAIVGFSDVLSMLTTQEEKQEMVHVIMNNCDMLLRLVDDILMASSMDAHAVKIVPVTVDFARSFSELCKSLEARVENPSVEFIVDTPCDTFVAQLDDDRIKQVITNFVTNAVKYTQQGHIRVGWRQQDGGLYIYCEDTGQGIPPEVQDKIFERFFKLNDYIQGTGLGLAICKAIADAYEGKIGVVSEGEGKGCTFWLWIPVEN